MLQKKNEGILFSAEIRVVGSYTDRLLNCFKVHILNEEIHRAVLVLHVK